MRYYGFLQQPARNARGVHSLFDYAYRLQTTAASQVGGLTESQASFLRRFREKLAKDGDKSPNIDPSHNSPQKSQAFQNTTIKRGINPLPSWLKLKIPKGASEYPNYVKIRNQLREKNLATVCQEAKCPNIGECWGGAQSSDGNFYGATATIMMMGKECTRGCRFCSIKTTAKPEALDPKEPEKIAQALQELSVDYIVITMVDRDDLADGGAEHVAKTIALIRRTNPSLYLEFLVGDFKGSQTSVQKVASSGLHVYAHNIETVERLTPRVRDRKASYSQSLNTLRWAKEACQPTGASEAQQLPEGLPRLFTKSSIMVGLGETPEEVLQTMRDLRANDVDFLTLGQYLQPDLNRMRVSRYLEQEEFDFFKEEGEKMGFRYVASGPLVRSSYKAGELFIRKILKGE
ncbi:lipoic acid synthetase mitochondrial precursor [Perkinsela sp. CCAP 1560/4]|nr:lipoic acid synthetase mitochondrial precursor [Perkinsela sp. CCAP 1560/4]|eukprot:KNH07468.1 lipoic acid synthetase mitochondrial precursor [Perkinsela sp. CCAP 1560/4]